MLTLDKLPHNFKGRTLIKQIFHEITCKIAGTKLVSWIQLQKRFTLLQCNGETWVWRILANAKGRRNNFKSSEDKPICWALFAPLICIYITKISGTNPHWPHMFRRAISGKPAAFKPWWGQAYVVGVIYPTSWLE